MDTRTSATVAIDLIRRTGIARARDLEAAGVSRVQLMRLVRDGRILRLDRGLYSTSDAPFTVHHSLAAAAARVPRGIVCLLSALRYHELTTQSPYQVWMAIGEKDRRPPAGSPPIRTVRFSGQALTTGVETHDVEGLTIRIYSPPKTVADCFKYRNKIGLDVAIEALRQCHRERRCSMDELWHYAKICRVAKVMRPYLESLA